MIVRGGLLRIALIGGALSLAVSLPSLDAQSAGVLTLRQVLADRSAMRSYIDNRGVQHQVTEQDEIFIAAANLLTDDGGAGQVDWSNTLPDKQCETADHEIASGSHRPVIRMGVLEKCNQRAGQPLSFEMLWQELFYELFNIQNDPGFIALVKEAATGKYSECEFTVASTRLEYYAEQKLSDFYKQVFSPWASAHELATNEKNWVISIKPNYEEWIAQYKDPNSYPWDYWGKYFTQTIVPYLDHAGIPTPLRSCGELQMAMPAQPVPEAALHAATEADDRGVEYWNMKDYTHAFSEFQSACDGGNLAGCYGLGVLYAYGDGVAQNYPKAIMLYQQACAGGEIQGCDFLGDLYKNGLGVRKNMKQAFKLYDQACKGGSNQGCQDRDALMKVMNR